MSFANRGSFTSTFLIWLPFIFLFLKCSGLNLSTRLNRNDESRHPCLVLDLGRAFSLSPLNNEEAPDEP